MESNKRNEKIDNNESKESDFENLDSEEIKKEYDDTVNENFFSAAFARMGQRIGSKLDSFAKAGRNAKKKLKNTFSRENMKSVGNKIKYAASKEGLRDAGKKISNVGSSIKTKALGLRISSNMNSFYMLKLKEVIENYDGSNSKDDFVKKITEGMQNYKEFVAEKVKSWLNNEEREKALESKINAGYNELDEKYNKLDYGWLEKKIPSFSKKIRIEILKKENCIEALKSHLKSYGKIDPLWDILTRGSKITRSGALKSKTIKLLFTMTNSLSECEENGPMDVGIYSNSLMSYLLKNFKGKGEQKDQDWKLQCGLLLVRYSQQEGSYFGSLGKMVDERVDKIYESISKTSKLVKLQKSCGTIQEMLDKASGSKKGTASIAIGVGMSYSNPVAIEVLKRVYTSKGIQIPDIADIQNNSGSIYELVDKIKRTINDEKITKYDTDLRYQKWFDSLYKIAKISDYDQILDKIKIHKHLKDFKDNNENFKKYMEEDYKKTIESKYSKTLDEYTSLLENLKKDLEKYSGEEFNDGGNPKLFEKAKKNLERFKYMLSNKFIEDEIGKELKNSSSKKAEETKNEEIFNSEEKEKSESNKENSNLSTENRIEQKI